MPVNYLGWKKKWDRPVEIPDTAFRLVVVEAKPSNPPMSAWPFTLQMAVPEHEVPTILTWVAGTVDLIERQWGCWNCTVRIRGDRGGLQLMWERTRAHLSVLAAEQEKQVEAAE